MTRASSIAALVCVGMFAAGAMFLMSPDTGPAVGRKAPQATVKVEAQRSVEPVAAADDKKPKVGKKRRKPEQVGPLVARGPGEGGGARRKVDPNRIRPNRLDMRSSNLEGTQQRLEAYAAEAQWSSEQALAVREHLMASHDQVNDIVMQVEEGELSWEEARPLMQGVREKEASVVREMLGDEYAAFEKAMAVGGNRDRRAAMRAGPRAPQTLDLP